MAVKFLSACSLVAWFFLALPVPAGAGQLILTIQDGRVMLSARDVSLRQILAEWERVGGTRIVNGDGVPGALVTIELVNVPEARALETLLRSVAGYVAATRPDPSATGSQFARIIIMPGIATPALVSAASPGSSAPVVTSGPSAGRPQVQRRVMSDGRVVTFVENSDRPGEVTAVENDPDEQPTQMGSPGAMRPPFQGPPRLPQGQTSADPYRLDPPGGQTQPGTRSAPTVPGTVATPGAIVPAPKQTPGTPPVPPRPPGI